MTALGWGSIKGSIIGQSILLNLPRFGLSVVHVTVDIQSHLYRPVA